MAKVIQRKNAKGDCFERAFNFLVNGCWQGELLGLHFGKPKLCHGIVWHKKTGYHIHGWVEDNTFAYDFFNNKLMVVLKSRYYSLGRIEDKPGHLFRYTAKQAIAKAIATDRYYFSNLNKQI